MADYLFIAVPKRSDATTSLIVIRDAVNEYYATQNAREYAHEHFRTEHAIRPVHHLYDPDRWTRVENAPPDRIGHQLLSTLKGQRVDP